MNTDKFYKHKTGEYLGRFIFSVEEMDTYGKSCGETKGTLLYFMPNNSKTWKFARQRLLLRCVCTCVTPIPVACSKLLWVPCCCVVLDDLPV